MPFSTNANTVSCPIQLELPVTITTLFILLAVNIKYNEIPYLNTWSNIVLKNLIIMFNILYKVIIHITNSFDVFSFFRIIYFSIYKEAV
jgi:hypothetical protein